MSKKDHDAVVDRAAEYLMVVVDEVVSQRVTHHLKGITQIAMVHTGKAAAKRFSKLAILSTQGERQQLQNFQDYYRAAGRVNVGKSSPSTLDPATRLRELAVQLSPGSEGTALVAHAVCLEHNICLEIKDADGKLLKTVGAPSTAQGVRRESIQFSNGHYEPLHNGQIVKVPMNPSDKDCLFASLAHVTSTSQIAVRQVAADRIIGGGDFVVSMMSKAGSLPDIYLPGGVKLANLEQDLSSANTRDVLVTLYRGDKAYASGAPDRIDPKTPDGQKDKPDSATSLTEHVTTTLPDTPFLSLTTEYSQAKKYAGPDGGVVMVKVPATIDDENFAYVQVDTTTGTMTVPDHVKNLTVRGRSGFNTIYDLTGPEAADILFQHWPANMPVLERTIQSSDTKVQFDRPPSLKVQEQERQSGNNKLYGHEKLANTTKSVGEVVLRGSLSKGADGISLFKI